MPIHTFLVPLPPESSLSDAESDDSSLFGSHPLLPTSPVSAVSVDLSKKPQQHHQQSPLRHSKSKSHQLPQKQGDPSRRFSSYVTPPLPRENVHRTQSVKLSRLQSGKKQKPRPQSYLSPADLRLPPVLPHKTPPKLEIPKETEPNNVLKLKIACDHLGDSKVAVKLRKDKLNKLSELVDVALYKLSPLVPWPQEKTSIRLVFLDSSLKPVLLTLGRIDPLVESLVMEYIGCKSKLLVKASKRK